MNRSKARRHRGTSRPAARVVGAQRARAERAAEEEAFIADEHARTAHLPGIDINKFTPKGPQSAVTYWQHHASDPLFVYFIQQTNGGPVKIGQALQPFAMVRNLQCGNPDELEVQEVVLASPRTEWLLHKHWAGFRVRRGSEWFDNAAVILAMAGAVRAEQVREFKGGASPEWVSFSLIECMIERERKSAREATWDRSERAA
ncbi:MAG: GIY-YIG nuclease family protein [Actinomycetota bacterium]|nr:GIY-YIG nuclease family protein [Actinomycetota bacterium]